MSFPKWKYHAEKEALVVDSELEEQALGEGWRDSPADFAQEVSAEKPQDKLAESEEKPAEPKKSRKASKA